MPDKYIELKMCDYTGILEELNRDYIMNSELNREDAQLYVKITDLNYYPIKFNIDNQGFNIEDNENYIGKEMAIGSKRQYFYKYIKIGSNSRIVNINYDEFKTAWNEDKYLIFRNGLLLNKGVYRIAIPSFDNNYGYKCIYSMTEFKTGDRLDIFYIESEESFNDVPFNGNMYVNIQRQWCINDGQLLFKIPYPYPTYPRGEKMFICMSDDGEYYDNRKDYTTSLDGEYITLNEKYNDMISYVDYLLFLFPYVMADWENEGGEDENQQSGNKTGIDLFQSYSILSKNSETTGIVNFYPTFDQYPIDNKNMMLFANTTYIDQSRYEIISNNQIRLLLDTDKKHSSVAKYTMLIFAEQKVLDPNMRKFHLRAEQVIAEEDRQQIFYIPEVDVQKESFLGFLGSVSLDLHKRCTWKPEIHQIIMNSDEDYVLKGRPVYFIFYEAQDNHLIRDKEISFKKMMWDVTAAGPNTIPKQLYEGSLKFDETNLMLFLNGTYLQPNRYTITHTDDGNNIISMNTPADTALVANKTLTGVYLVSYTPNYQTEGDGPYKYTDLMEDHDWIWWDEMYAIPYPDPEYVLPTALNTDLNTLLAVGMTNVDKDIVVGGSVTLPEPIKEYQCRAVGEAYEVVYDYDNYIANVVGTDGVAFLPVQFTDNKGNLSPAECKALFVDGNTDLYNQYVIDYYNDDVITNITYVTHPEQVVSNYDSTKIYFQIQYTYPELEKPAREDVIINTIFSVMLTFTDRNGVTISTSNGGWSPSLSIGLYYEDKELIKYNHDIVSSGSATMEYMQYNDLDKTTISGDMEVKSLEPIAYSKFLDGKIDKLDREQLDDVVDGKTSITGSLNYVDNTIYSLFCSYLTNPNSLYQTNEETITTLSDNNTFNYSNDMYMRFNFAVDHPNNPANTVYQKGFFTNLPKTLETNCVNRNGVTCNDFTVPFTVKLYKLAESNISFSIYGINAIAYQELLGQRYPIHVTNYLNQSNNNSIYIRYSIGYVIRNIDTNQEIIRFYGIKNNTTDLLMYYCQNNSKSPSGFPNVSNPETHLSGGSAHTYTGIFSGQTSLENKNIILYPGVHYSIKNIYTIHEVPGMPEPIVNYPSGNEQYNGTISIYQLLGSQENNDNSTKCDGAVCLFVKRV